MKQLRIDLKKCEAGMESCEHECESSCAEKVFKLTDPGMATLHITRNEDGSANAVLCDQCGDCVVVCPTEALKRNKLGVVILDKKLCVGCYMCIGFCDKEIFERNPDWVVPYKCTSCGVCVKACPHAALEIVDVPEPAYKII